MTFTEKHLKKLSDDEYSDCNNDKVVWVRHLCHLHLTLSSLKVSEYKIFSKRSYRSNRNSKDSSGKPIQLTKLIRSDIEKGIVLDGVSDGACNDVFYALDNAEKDGRYKVIRPSQNIIMKVRKGESTKEDTLNYNKGVFRGDCSYSTWDESGSDVVFDLFLPEKDLQDLVFSIKGKSSPVVRISVLVACLGDKFELAYGEPRLSQDFIIDDRSMAAIVEISVCEEILPSVIKKGANDTVDEFDSYEDEPAEDEISDEKIQVFVTIARSIKTSIGSVTFALYAILGVMLANIFVK